MISTPHTLFWGLLTASLAIADSSKLRLFHRVYRPIAPQVPFSERGELSISDSGLISTFQPSQTFSQDLLHFAESLKTAEGNADSAMYQVALEREGDTMEGEWDISSVRVCHLEHATAESFILHVTDHGKPKPYALDYFVSPTPHDGSCSRSRKSKKHQESSSGPATASAFLAFAGNFKSLNTTVSVRSSRFPPLPELRTPPPLSAEGEPIQPVPEKSFLQKYWMYIAALLVALLMSGGSAEEERPRRGPQ